MWCGVVRGAGSRVQEKPEVVVEKVTRSKRKSITSIKGLETFGKKPNTATGKVRDSHHSTGTQTFRGCGCKAHSVL